MRQKIQKVLVVNRGEIAVRVIRACREMGLKSAAVYSDADRHALHVRMADEAYRIGAAPASESYLNIARVLEVARHCGADAVHPGYGFLSENASFADACEQAGIKFIGPSAQAMRILGSKTGARQAMAAAGIPFVPGSDRGLTRKEASEVADKVGYPVMLKATAGGGGKGMRLVRTAQEMDSAYQAASSEALRAFSNGELYIEKYIEGPRHIEVQIVADEHGNTVYLGERECSVQRRHQKVIEEAPSPVVDTEMRRCMGEVAVRVAKMAAYTNAGTVEFLVDRDRNFYFLEVNARLQVEHPVTEMVTGLDLVQLQVGIAQGERLPFTQDQVEMRGHAIECRIYAEDPDNNFFPSPGVITRLVSPSGPGIRLDSGVFEGWSVPLEYDPLLAKLIAHAPTREQAIARLLGALEEYFVGGIKTNLGLFRRILRDEDFLAGRLDTGLLDRLLADKMPTAPLNGEARLVAVAAALFARNGQSNGNGTKTIDNNGTWKKKAREEALRQ